LKKILDTEKYTIIFFLEQDLIEINKVSI
jgi:hypothetical protein